MGIGFRGNTYLKQITQTSANGQALESSEKKLTNVVIYFQDAPQKVGGLTTYVIYGMYYAAGERLTLYNVDLSTLYFANPVGTAKNGTIVALGVEAE